MGIGLFRMVCQWKTCDHFLCHKTISILYYIVGDILLFYEMDYLEVFDNHTRVLILTKQTLSLNPEKQITCQCWRSLLFVDFECNLKIINITKSQEFPFPKKDC